MTVSEIKSFEFFRQLTRLSYVNEIYLYGSRARGDHSAKSDIDLAIICPKATTEQWLEILEIIENADTLLEIDCVRYDDLANSELRENIDREHVVLFSRVEK